LATVFQFCDTKHTVCLRRTCKIFQQGSSLSMAFHTVHAWQLRKCKDPSTIVSGVRQLYIEGGLSQKNRLKMCRRLETLCIERDFVPTWGDEALPRLMADDLPHGNVQRLFVDHGNVMEIDNRAWDKLTQLHELH